MQPGMRCWDYLILWQDSTYTHMRLKQIISVHFLYTNYLPDCLS